MPEMLEAINLTFPWAQAPPVGAAWPLAPPAPKGLLFSFFSSPSGCSGSPSYPRGLGTPSPPPVEGELALESRGEDPCPILVSSVPPPVTTFLPYSFHPLPSSRSHTYGGGKWSLSPRMAPTSVV